ncbi:MAG TPA: helix-turn-helix transcriptional regulator [Candidatus Binatia bacterium]|jgi:HTH-type transcriptional regulator/antitoxin HipB|nr:helix-turn-helix transcriptional regulator [Candidatus Binatia bacterium]
MPPINTPTDLGAIIRDHRRRQNLDQVTLARNVGVSRQWIVEIEKGKPRAGIGLVLRTLQALGVTLTVADETATPRTPGRPAVDLDAIVDAARRPRS